MSLIDVARKDIIDFLEENNDFFFNERDMQIHMAIYLAKVRHYDDVDVEYHIPRQFNEDLDDDYSAWDTKTLSIDLMLRLGNEYLPVELKYKLKGIKSHISRLGESSKEEIQIVTDQSAQDLGRYDFWKDVKRIELLKKHFVSVRNGLAVFLTNDSTYMRTPTSDVNYYQFRMDGHDGIGGGYLRWKKSIGDKYKDFPLDSVYHLDWRTKTISKEKKSGELESMVEYKYVIAVV